MEYDQQNDKIISETGSDIEIYPLGITFPESTEIELSVNGDVLLIPSAKIREVIDGLIQAAVRVGI